MKIKWVPQGQGPLNVASTQLCPLWAPAATHPGASVGPTPRRSGGIQDGASGQTGSPPHAARDDLCVVWSSASDIFSQPSWCWYLGLRQLCRDAAFLPGMASQNHENYQREDPGPLMPTGCRLPASLPTPTPCLKHNRKRPPAPNLWLWKWLNPANAAKEMGSNVPADPHSWGHRAKS